LFLSRKTKEKFEFFAFDSKITNFSFKKLRFCKTKQKRLWCKMGEEGLVDCKFIRKVVVRPAAWSKKFALYAKVVSSVGAKFVAVLCVAFVLLRRARTKTE
jgi:hypothetical protein